MSSALILLAAGRSRRFGPADKRLTPIGGEPLVVRAVRRLSQANGHGGDLKIVVVIGADQAALDDAVAAAVTAAVPRAAIVRNPAAAAGIGSSIAAGIASLGPEIEATVVVPADMPLLTAATVARVLTACLDGPRDRPACVVTATGLPASPVAWPRALFPALRSLGDDRGGRDLLRASPFIAVAIADAAELTDIDTVDDLAALAQHTRDPLIAKPAP